MNQCGRICQQVSQPSCSLMLSLTYYFFERRHISGSQRCVNVCCRIWNNFGIDVERHQLTFCHILVDCPDLVWLLSWSFFWALGYHLCAKCLMSVLCVDCATFVSHAFEYCSLIFSAVILLQQPLNFNNNDLHKISGAEPFVLDSWSAPP